MKKPAPKEKLDFALAAIADPARRKILQLLKQRGCCSIGKQSGMCACDVEAGTKLSQPTISHHMRILGRAGLVQSQRVGKWMWYQRNDAALRKLITNLGSDL